MYIIIKIRNRVFLTTIGQHKVTSVNGREVFQWLLILISVDSNGSILRSKLEKDEGKRYLLIGFNERLSTV